MRNLDQYVNDEQAVIDALNDDITRTVVMIKLDFGSGITYAHNRLGEITYDGNTYLGMGNLGNISSVSEGTDVKPYSMKLTLQGFEPDLVSKALNDEYQGRDARIYMGLLDDENQLIGGAPFMSINYRIDYMEAAIDGNKASLSVILQTRLADWARSNPGRYTDAYQQFLYPNDKGLEYVAEMADKEINWGVPGGGSGAVGGGGRGGGAGTNVRMHLR